MKKNKRSSFYYKKSYLDRRLQKDVMEDGIAYVPCRVDGISDIISKFSTKDCESLDGEFVDYLLDFIDCIPEEYPVVLEVHGPKFTDEEKKLITETIESDTDYMLGKTEAENRHHRRVFFWMAVGTIGSGFLLAVIKKFISDEIPVEFFYVLFWLFADEFVRYLFIENSTYKDDKIRAGRIASMKVEFVEE
ncbi:MAG: hypothetical protein IJR19_09970 [Lachnospiraceae bacterium]|nr:hypothetical protein [Lachnospiraceae bacterium]